MTCRNCRWYKINDVKDKAGRVRKDRMAECVVSIPLPASIRLTALGMLRTYMAPDDGAGCVFFDPREA